MYSNNFTFLLSQAFGVFLNFVFLSLKIQAIGVTLTEWGFPVFSENNCYGSNLFIYFSLVHMHFQYFFVFYSPNFNVKLIKLLCN